MAATVLTAHQRGHMTPEELDAYGKQLDVRQARNREVGEIVVEILSDRTINLDSLTPGALVDINMNGIRIPALYKDYVDGRVRFYNLIRMIGRRRLKPTVSWSKLKVPYTLRDSKSRSGHVSVIANDSGLKVELERVKSLLDSYEDTHPVVLNMVNSAIGQL